MSTEMEFASIGILALIGAFCVGIGLARRSHRSAGVLLAGAAVAAAIALALSGSWRPVLYLLAIAGLLGGLAVDRPGDPARRALGLLGIATFLFALTTSALYA